MLTSPDYLLNAQPDYRFEALPSSGGAFRLLELLPSDEAEVIRLKSCVAWLDEFTLIRRHRTFRKLAGVSASLSRSQRGFVALSYVWGTPGDRRKIEVDGKPYLVQQNLWTFLREMRRSARLLKRLLFVDAICIDQENVTERNSQVGLMGRIYSSADQVFAWVGEEADGSDDLLRTLDDGSLGLRGNPSASRFESTLRKLKAVYGKDGARYETAREAFLARSYWTRLWVVQEILLSREVILLCGQRASPMSKLNDLYLRHHIDGYYREFNDLSPLITAKSSHPDNDPPQDLAGLLSIYLGHHCTDPKNKVFGILGLIPNLRKKSKRRNGVGIEIDYAQDMLRLFFSVMAVADFDPSAMSYGRVLRSALGLCDYIPTYPLTGRVLQAASMSEDELRESLVLKLWFRQTGRLTPLSEDEAFLVPGQRGSPLPLSVSKYKKAEGVKYCRTCATIQEGDVVYVSGYDMDESADTHVFGLIFRDEPITRDDTLFRYCVGPAFIFEKLSDMDGDWLSREMDHQLMDLSRLRIEERMARRKIYLHSNDREAAYDFNVVIMLSWLEMFMITMPFKKIEWKPMANESDIWRSDPRMEKQKANGVYNEVEGVGSQEGDGNWI